MQDAKARFSELVRRVRSEGPQRVTVHGRDEVVVVTAEEYRRLRGDPTGEALIAAMQASPHRGIDLEPKRVPMPVRESPYNGVLVTGWLLDTNILSELRRPKPNRKVLTFVAAQPLDLLYVSAVTLAEIRFGIERVGDANRRAELNDWLAQKVRPMFESRVLAITEDIMVKWRLLVEDGRKAGHTFSQPDLIIAATALHHGLTVVSRDVADYQKARAPVLNPWVDPLPASAS